MRHVSFRTWWKLFQVKLNLRNRLKPNTPKANICPCRQSSPCISTYEVTCHPSHVSTASLSGKAFATLLWWWAVIKACSLRLFWKQPRVFLNQYLWNLCVIYSGKAVGIPGGERDGCLAFLVSMMQKKFYFMACKIWSQRQLMIHGNLSLVLIPMKHCFSCIWAALWLA